ncbi:MAG: hypothetical protein IT308_11395 [Anaerolineaceae bacterium]|nr:hypothetical protein [Anaerolineaceae bacterium]
MSDLFDRVTAEGDVFKKILSKLPVFSGYFERQNRRAADKLMRETIASRFEEQWGRISSVQRSLISGGEIQYIDDLEAAAVKLRQFIDRVRTASYGYAGFFDAIKINEEELSRLYDFDLTLLNMVDEISRAIDNLEASIGTEGLPASIRHLTALASQCVEAFNRRTEVIQSGETTQSQ